MIDTKYIVLMRLGQKRCIRDVAAEQAAPLTAKQFIIKLILHDPKKKSLKKIDLPTLIFYALCYLNTTFFFLALYVYVAGKD